MRTLITLALFGLATSAAHALPDVKKLAQFDLGFAKCEARFEHMKGHGDEAYLALWKVNPTPARRAELDRQRKTDAYRQARVQAQKKMAKDSPKLDEKIRNQCEATWSEALRNRPTRAPAASAPAGKTASPAASGTAKQR